MLEVVNCFAKLNLEVKDFTLVIQGLNEMGYASVIWQSKLTMLSTAGITKLDNDMLDWIGYYNLREENRFIYRADIFVVDRDVIYFINQAKQFSEATGKVEMGIITDKPQSGLDRLGKYANAFLKVLKTKLDGRRVRHMDLSWYAFEKNEEISTHVSFYKSFTYPILDESESVASLYLADHSKRNLVRKIAEAGSLKHLDIKGEDKNLVIELIEELIYNNLVTVRYIVACRKKSIPIGVVNSKDELTGKNHRGLSCPHCGEIFANELLQKSFVLSELGKKMMKGSHWMLVLLTNTLIKNGIAEKNVIWNLSEAAEEVDCAVQFKDKVWIFELKDRNFEAGDSHPIMYRAVKFRASKAIIITTGKVTKDARKVFDDLSAQNKSIFTNGYPLFIEGLLSLNDAIAKLIKNETLINVLNKSKQISQAATIDFSPLFSKIFGKYTIEHKGQFSNQTISRHV